MASKMNKKELESLRYDTAVAMLRQMSNKSVVEFALDRMLQQLEEVDEKELVNLRDQYTARHEEQNGQGTHA